MNMVIGIVFMTVLMGIFVPRWQLKHGVLLGGWVVLMVLVFYSKSK